MKQALLKMLWGSRILSLLIQSHFWITTCNSKVEVAACATSWFDKRGHYVTSLCLPFRCRSEVWFFFFFESVLESRGPEKGKGDWTLLRSCSGACYWIWLWRLSKDCLCWVLYVLPPRRGVCLIRQTRSSAVRKFLSSEKKLPENVPFG